MNQQEQAVLIDRAQAGEREALGELLTAHRQMMFGLAWRILGNREDALDAAQEACMRACKHLHSFDPRRPFAAWMRQVAVRASLDLARRRVAGTSREEVPDHRPDPQLLAERGELAAAVGRAMQDLSPAQRTAFVCRAVEGMSTRETARAMGCLQPTVRWHLFEARKRLAKCLAPFAGGSE